MAYWLVKSEPTDWSFADHLEAGVTAWTGVTNAQAQGSMRQMQAGDRVLFYHSGKEKAIVGLCEVARGPYPDPQDQAGKLILVDLKAVRAATTPVPLATVKAEPAFAQLALVRQSRLSVMPIDAASWKQLVKLAGLGS